MVNPMFPMSVVQLHQTSVMKMKPSSMNLVAAHMFVLQYNAINLNDGGWYTFSSSRGRCAIKAGSSSGRHPSEIKNPPKHFFCIILSITYNF